MGKQTGIADALAAHQQQHFTRLRILEYKCKI